MRRAGRVRPDGQSELGLGAGGHGHAIHSEGGPDVTVGERISAFTEAVHVIRALTVPGPPVTIGGRYHRLHQAMPGPPHPHPIGLWIGAVKPRMLRLVGRIADGWIPSATRIPPHELDAANARIDDAARAVGRDPGEIRRLCNIPAPPQAQPGVWADQLARIAIRHGISRFLLFSDDYETISRFADVAARVREAVT
ncbi:LLM class flavin-dependent oxidoreductase [Micromonospora sp. B11E3]|uniref:LLM class flavin-dependent oxidoreductase n=1 Tax=Micromonospora sp. B11E3 TaxID=3153562 RepID=UPI00325C7CF7